MRNMSTANEKTIYLFGSCNRNVSETLSICAIENVQKISEIFLSIDMVKAVRDALFLVTTKIIQCMLLFSTRDQYFAKNCKHGIDYTF